ncbi:ECF transporter S component [Candidatus Bathyarchaeota archaeon]|nr:ECF transporter S component [Candidatus Bathyarchaeota archaeon]
MEPEARILNSRQVSLVAVFAALSVAVIMFIPGIPMIGLPGARITLDAAVAPVYGAIIGPYLGGLAALLGGLVVAGFRGWPIFSILTSFCPAVSALVAGAVTRKTVNVAGLRVRGWILGALVITLLIVGWYLTWVGQRAPFYPAIHWAGLALILAFRGRVSSLFDEGGKRGLSIAVFIASYCGLVADHMLGNIIFITGVGWFIPLEALESVLRSMNLPGVPALFMFMLPISTVERAAMALIGMLFGTGLVFVLRSSRLMRIAGRD